MVDPVLIFIFFGHYCFFTNCTNSSQALHSYLSHVLTNIRNLLPLYFFYSKQREALTANKGGRVVATQLACMIILLVFHFFGQSETALVN